jgi:hypothetical protein
MKLTRRGVLAMGSAVAATALLAACGEADEDSDDDGADGGNGGQGQAGDPTATPTPQATSVFPDEADDAVVRIEYEGGFMAPEDLVRRTPLNSLYADGRMFYSGPIPEIFPQPAAPNVLVTTLSPLGMQAVGERIVETGLFEDGDRIYDSSASLLADAAFTVFTVRLAGQEPVRVSVYALEFEESPGDGSGMSEEEIEARRKLRELFNYITGAPTSFPTDHIAEGERSYTPERLQLVTYPWSEVPYDFEVEPQSKEWPLDVSPLTIGEPFNLPGHTARSAVVEGADAAAMLAALADANVLTRWERGEDEAYLINRPLLPGEEPYESTFEPGGQTGEISHPTGEEELVLRYIIEGGFVPLEYHVTNMPVAALYGDGRMFTQGVQIMIYPPPALPALNLDQLTPEGIQLLLQEADAAGLLQGEQEWTKLSNFVTDAGTGFLTIHANGEVHQISVYAPGMTGLDDIGDAVSPEEVEFRQRFDAFVGKLTALGEWLPENVFVPVPAEYPVDRLQIVSQPAEVRGEPEDVQPNEIDWPLATPLAETGEPFSTLEMARCFVLEGQNFADVMSLLPDATTLTRWISGGEAYVFLIRPLLPGEEGCQEPF